VIFGILPYWFRFWQCIHKYHESGMKVNLVNAGKYFSSMLPGLFTIWTVGTSRDPTTSYAGLKKEANTIFWIYFTA